MADALDSKSGVPSTCGFKSHLRYHFFCPDFSAPPRNISSFSDFILISGTNRRIFTEIITELDILFENIIFW